ncbi:Transposase IS110 family [Flavobacterium indicum GPTSA100-9 = DSM 17447]|uniref:Transposase IS110 family n=1 Tax=Flavobacterium indicum (strain DSM 17447 / CIP 109464 / GPTSA100-9) TaxID=1094466 RepID=H8XUG5_FLAIG|nr:IS110 family transposase [Flavobacterium indicum]CCG52948.1 Transposase IS110 family [Flavobacterium indicum GPTSA100-9 = DSM 17447]
MKKVTETIGIDVSKLTLDVMVRTTNIHKQFSNDTKGFKQIITWLMKQKINLDQSLFCFEHTGWYCLMLSYFLYENKHAYCCINAIEIKRSMGLKRGKSDKADAWEIANYAWLRRDELIPSVPPAKKLIELQRMMSLREQLIKQQTASKNLLKGMIDIVLDQVNDVSVGILKENIAYLEKQITSTEKAMNELIKQDNTMITSYKLSKTVKGVGMVLAVQMLLHTHNYTRFESSRQFAAYCGLVPYPYQSGTSIHGRNKIHPISDRKMKSLLSMSAISAIQHDKELKIYYQKRVEEGKPKMVVLNIIRNKIVSRIFATVNRRTPYVEMNKFLA